MTDKQKPIKVFPRKEPYIITDGNGGTLRARVKQMTQQPRRVHYVTRNGPVGAYTKHPIVVTVPAFRKLLVSGLN